MQIWDTAGQERFKSLRTPFYRGADCCMLTFAVDNMQSFRNLAMWRKEFLYYADIQDGITFPFVIIGNKVDTEVRQVSGEDARSWCSANGGLPYFETSAKDSTNVEQAFLAAVCRLREVEEQMDIKPAHGNTVDLSRAARSKSSCC